MVGIDEGGTCVSSMSEKDKLLNIKDHLTGEAREFLMNKSQEERKKLSRVIKLLSGRFGSAQNQRQARMEFNSRYKKSKKAWIFS